MLPVNSVAIMHWLCSFVGKSMLYRSPALTLFLKDRQTVLITSGYSSVIVCKPCGCETKGREDQVRSVSV